ncbi:MAG: DNA repair protein RadA [Lachnospiraceae bacterium]|nr:DNA repair protein RadA [Lachnospiraceae bacterium]
MSKKTNKTSFYCKECGFESIKWLGQCPSCGSWNAFVEAEKVSKTISNSIGINTTAEVIEPKSLSNIEDVKEERVLTGISEFDNLLGGGIVKGSLSLIGGAPGIGKSTLLLQVVKALGDKGINVLYVSGEESLNQIKIRANRVGKFSESVKFISDTNMDSIIATVIKTKPEVLIIDSIQTMALNLDDKVPGSITQVRACTQAIFRVCKEYNISSFIVGHITKEGTVAGPKLLEHIVDVVLYFEDDQLKNLRILRCNKNRFGSCDALAVFEMTSEGLREIKNPSEIFLEGRPSNATGCVVTCVIESGRPILLEIQALVTKSAFGIARRTINGADVNRLNLLIAIIEKRMNIPLYQYDIYINITGGLKLKDTSIDLAIIMAIVSSYKNVALKNDCIYCGEVGLSGEVRSITNINSRVQEAIKLGYKIIFLPKTNVDSLDENMIKKYKDIEIKPIQDVLN